MIIWPAKEAGDVADYVLDFGPSLQTDEAIVSVNVVADGVTVDSSSHANGMVSLWLSGGAEGTIGRVTVQIATNSSPQRKFTEIGVLPIGGLPISLAKAKQWLRIELDDSEDDLIITASLRAAVAHIETVTGLNMTPRPVRHPVAGWPATGAVKLHRGPVREVVAVRYRDGSGVEQVLNDFRLVEGLGGGLMPAVGETWPSVLPGPGSVVVEYLAGFDPGEMPEELRQAAKLLMGHFYAHRGDTDAAPPKIFDELLSPFRPIGIA